ncbi:MAG: EVE domain-containing protein [Spartobacteria bacterium]
MKNYWLVKTEPDSYSWETFTGDKKTSWTGVRNFAARKNLRAMEKGDGVLFYHTGDEKVVVGIASVIRTAYPDATATEGEWSVVDLALIRALRRPVTLAEIKKDSRLKDIVLVRQSRLSVMPIGAKEFQMIVKMGS